jgi:hypothetical protein
MKKHLYLLAFWLLFAAPAFMAAQTAAELDALLETSAATCAQAARFVLASAGITDAGIEAAFEEAALGEIALGEIAYEEGLARHWFPQGTAANDPITLGTLSFLMMRAFNIRGGLMYRLLPGPRYAFRTMVSRSFIQGAADPAMSVSGERFLHILGNVLTLMGEEL